MLCLLLILATGILETGLEAADTTAGVPQTGWKPRNDRGAKTASAWRERYGATSSRQKQSLTTKRSWQEQVQQKVLADPFGDRSGNGTKKIEQTGARAPQQSTQSPMGKYTNPIFRLITTEDRQEVHGAGATLELIDTEATVAVPTEHNMSVEEPMQSIAVIQLNGSPAPTTRDDAASAENNLETTHPTRDAAASAENKLETTHPTRDAADALAVVQKISLSAPEDLREDTERAAIEEAPEIVIPTQNLIEVEQIASLASNEANDEAAVTTAENEADLENGADTATPTKDFSVMQLETTVASTKPGDEAEEAGEKADYKTVSSRSILVEKIPEAIASTTVEENSTDGAELAAYGGTILAQTNNAPIATNAADRPQETGYEKDCQLSREYLLDRKLSDISLNIAVHGKPGEDFPVSCDLETQPLPLHHYRLGEQELLTFAWTASGLCHKPLYFEEVQAERYGHTIGLLNQPFLSAAHFFCNTAVLPYKMGMRPPQECVYPLGRYRAGSYAPRYIPAVPISIRGALVQAGGVLAAVFVLP